MIVRKFNLQRCLIEPLESRRMLSGGVTLLHDDFNGNSLNQSLWHQPAWDPKGSTYLGRTQLQVLGSSPAPAVSRGALHVNLQSYNPTQLPGQPSFWGGEVVSNNTFSLTPGKTIDFQYRARINMTTGGGVLGLFLYGVNRNGRHDEIDTELESTQVANGANAVETNVYSNEPLGVGSPGLASLPSRGKLTGWHTYDMKLDGGLTVHHVVISKPSVSWYVDGVLVRSETRKIPTHAMNAYVNFWAPDQIWPQAYNSAIQPTANAAQNTLWTADIDSVTVTSVADRR